MSAKTRRREEEIRKKHLSQRRRGGEKGSRKTKEKKVAGVVRSLSIPSVFSPRLCVSA
jgi:hypothetical protein